MTQVKSSPGAIPDWKEKEDRSASQSSSRNDSNTASRLSNEEIKNPALESTNSTIPDGGVQAWLQVLSGFMLYINAWGMVTAFGVFQTFYTQQYLPGYSNSTVAWIGTIQGFLLAFTTIFTGPILDRGHPHWLICGGGFLVVFGLMMTSLCTSYWQLMLAQGICVGIGTGAIFIVAVAVLPGWFQRKRALATGISATGSSIGGIIYPIVFHRLEPKLGFGWSVRVIAFIALGTCLVSLAVAQMKTTPPPRPKIVDFTGFKEFPFTIFAIVSFTGATGLYIPFFFITEYARSQSHLSDTLSFYMLPVLSAGSILGRTIPAVLADRHGSLKVLMCTQTVSAILAFCWIAIKDSEAGLIIWGLLYGAFSGAFVSLQTPTVASVTPDMRFVGGRMGMNNFCFALGVLVGNPIAGAINMSGNWIGLQVFCGATLAISAGLVAIMWSVKAGKTPLKGSQS